jgi:erythromycin esterase
VPDVVPGELHAEAIGQTKLVTSPFGPAVGDQADSPTGALVAEVVRGNEQYRFVEGRTVRMKVPASVGAAFLGWSLASIGHAQFAPAPEPVNTSAVVEYLSAHAIPLKSVAAGHGFEDLKPLKKILSGANIVGLGEATHGTREFFQFKHRMLEFLVERMGFNVFAIEASYVACLNIDDYVVHGKGDPAAALASQKFWTWDTEEVADMIRWMREYNSKRPLSRRIRFLGYDMQAFNQAFDVIPAYVKHVAPEDLPKVEEALQPMRPSPDAAGNSRPASSPEINAAQDARLRGLIDLFEQNKKKYAAQSSAGEFEIVLQHVRILSQYHHAFVTTRSRAAARDQYMAENIRYLMKQLGPKTKMVIWAHNAHVAVEETYNGGPAMGHYLRQWYGPRYHVLGFAFNRGSFQSVGRAGEGQPGRRLQEFTLPAAEPGSLGWYLERGREGRPYQNYIIDFRSAPRSGPVADWLDAPQSTVSIGAFFAEPLSQWMTQPVLRQEYDGMIFISQTTRARPNPTGIRPLAPEKK